MVDFLSMSGGIQEIIRTLLTMIVFPFVVKWLVERNKGDLAKRIALIAADIAASVYSAYPTWTEAKLIEEIARQLASQFPSLSAEVTSRAAAAALSAARLPDAVRRAQQSR